MVKYAGKVKMLVPQGIMGLTPFDCNPKLVVSRVFSSKLIEGVEVGVISILFLVIQLLEAVDGAAFNFSSLTS